jgi:hypothetical protein
MPGGSSTNRKLLASCILGVLVSHQPSNEASKQVGLRKLDDRFSLTLQFDHHFIISKDEWLNLASKSFFNRMIFLGCQQKAQPPDRKWCRMTLSLQQRCITCGHKASWQNILSALFEIEIENLLLLYRVLALVASPCPPSQIRCPCLPLILRLR